MVFPGNVSQSAFSALQLENRAKTIFPDPENI